MATQNDLCFACWSGKLAAIPELLATCDDINVRDRDGRTPLVNASLNKDGNGAAIVSLLLPHNPDLNAADNAGWTALHFAAQELAIDVATILLDAGATIDALDLHGNTPLMKAVFNSRGDGDMISLFRGRGADAYRENNHGQTAVGLARLIANFDVAQFFPDLPGMENQP